MSFGGTLILFSLVSTLAASETGVPRSAAKEHSDIELPSSLKFHLSLNHGASENAVEPPLKIGSFNIQTLTDKKMQRPNVMSIVEKVILRYDLILIMEIMTLDDIPMKKLLLTINRLSPDGVTYNMTLSSRHPYTKEQCAFIYRTDKLKVFRASTYYDENKVFYRRPLIVTFKALTLRDMDQFVVVGLHVKPNRAVEEMNGLATVYDYIRQTYRLSDVLLMGDFNADCSYVKEGEWENITLWTREEFNWPIKHNFDTTTNYKSCALDRFVYAGNKMNDGIIVSTAGVFNFQEAYGLTKSETKEVSDHWPIEIQIRGKMSKEAEKSLFSSACVTVSEKVEVLEPIGQSLSNRITEVGFNFVANLSDHVLMINRASDETAALSSLKRLRTVLPQLVSSNQIQGVLYKVKYGGMHDKSSYVPVANPKFWIAVQHLKEINSISICKETSVN